MSPRKRQSPPAPEMRLTTLMLADHAEAANGKLYVTGGCWNQIFAAQFPVRHGHLSLAMAIDVPWTATNERHAIEIDMVDSDGASAIPKKIGGGFEVGRPPGWRPGDPNTVVAVFNIDGLPLQKPTDYAFVVRVDGRELGRLPFRGMQIQQPPSTM